MSGTVPSLSLPLSVTTLRNHLEHFNKLLLDVWYHDAFRHRGITFITSTTCSGTTMRSNTRSCGIILNTSTNCSWMCGATMRSNTAESPYRINSVLRDQDAFQHSHLQHHSKLLVDVWCHDAFRHRGITFITTVTCSGTTMRSNTRSLITSTGCCRITGTSATTSMIPSSHEARSHRRSAPRCDSHGAPGECP